MFCLLLFIDIDDVKQRLIRSEKKNDRMEELIGKNRNDIKTIKKNLEKVLKLLKNESDSSMINCDYLAQEYAITLPVKSRPEFDALEQKLKTKKSKMRSDTVSSSKYYY